MKKRTPAPATAPEELEDLSPRLRERLERLVPHLLELGMGWVHSAEREDDGGRETEVDCAARTSSCRAVCCSFRFALTPGEAEAGLISWDRSSPYFIAQGDDGYCTHHDRRSGRCLIWENRPLRCRRYDCRRESDVWEEGPGRSLRPGLLGHLPGGGISGDDGGGP